MAYYIYGYVCPRVGLQTRRSDLNFILRKSISSIVMNGLYMGTHGLLYYTARKVKYLLISFPGHCIFLIADISKYPIVIRILDCIWGDQLLRVN